MRILFCSIAWMSEYKGIAPGYDEPIGGGAYVVENGEAHECWNFDPVTIQNDDGSTEQICFGSVETKTARSGKRQELHLEHSFSLLDIKTIYVDKSSITAYD